MRNKHNLVLYIDKNLVEKSKALGFNLSKTFENHLKHLIKQFSNCNSANNCDLNGKKVSWCGRRDLNPGSQAWKACVLNQLDDDRHLDTSLNRKQENKPISNKAEEAIINTLIAVKGNGIREGTCRQINYKLKELARNADIFQPEAVKKYISEAINQITGEALSQQTRNKFAYAYSKFCEIHEIFWRRPYYKVDEKIPLIPTTENVELIINNATQKYATIFTILAETGAEGKELEKTDRNHIDTEHGIINITGCKGHGSGSYKLKKKTAEMLRIYLYKHPEKHPFPKSNIMGQVWRDTRERTAIKLCKPELNKIPLRKY